MKKSLNIKLKVGGNAIKKKEEPADEGLAVSPVKVNGHEQTGPESAQEQSNLQAVFNSVNVGLFLIDADGEVRRVNRAASQWINKKGLDMIGVRPGQSLNCANADGNKELCGRGAHCSACQIRRVFESALRLGKPIHGVETEAAFTINGKKVWLWLELSADPVLINGQRQVILAINDITGRKRTEGALRQSEEKYKTLAETSPDCIKLFNQQGELLYINKAGLEEHRLKDMTEAMNWDYLGCVIKKDQKKFKESFKKALAGEINTIEIEHTHEGSVREVCLETMAPVKNQKGEVEAVYGVSRDISELKKIDRAKTEFVSMASHQLRTPLTSAGFALELFLKEFADKISPEQRDYLKNAHQDLGFMTDLVNRLLNISRIEMGTFTDDPKKVKLKEFMDGVVNNLEILTRKKNQQLIKEYASDLPEFITVDTSIFHNVLQNLISNAVKYTPENGKITVSMNKKDTGILFGVADTGPGIPPEIQDKVFTKLYKAHELLKTESESSGLGLYIAKLFIEELGGKIWLETKKDRGTTFYIYLPLEAKKDNS